ncbi:tautomerase family protein [Methanosphaera sp. ISO3-F5]|uniref:tautomerase family protein n=1 Tax=Methanosphaera sp. ISO3-F5 TaxID=1452353 RepID=UPI002B26240F|nr:tautomerase family protein [Methanosphaera sp. ISO3-F5]WQH65067.1 tautomerase family protein [Methanosphaera sp. ISO3-F5]
MPLITVEASKKLSKETKKTMIEDASKVVAEEFGVPIQAITMMIYENSPENIGVGGKPVSKE